MRVKFVIYLPLLLLCNIAYPQSDSTRQLMPLFDYDRNQPLDIKDSIIQTREGTILHQITYASPISGRVSAYMVLPAGKGPFAGIVFGHWGYGTGTEFLPEALLYAKAGAASLLIDYPWVRPDPWRRNVSDFARPENDRDIYIQAVIDLRRGIDLLTARADIDSSRIAYVGHSYGAQWGAILSAVDKRLKGVALIGGVGRQEDIFLDSDDPDFVQLRQALTKEQLNKYLTVTGILNAIRFVPLAAPTPLLFQFARFERYFDNTSMQRYAAAASEPKKVLWYDTGHELNDTKALIDRSRWLMDILKIKDVKAILETQIGGSAE